MSKFIVIWRLRECMQKARINSVLDLHRRIKLVDQNAINYAQLARIIETPPARLNLQTLAVLTVVLSCKVSDIIDVPPCALAGLEVSDHDDDVH